MPTRYLVFRRLEVKIVEVNLDMGQTAKVKVGKTVVNQHDAFNNLLPVYDLPMMEECLRALRWTTGIDFWGVTLHSMAFQRTRNQVVQCVSAVQGH